MQKTQIPIFNIQQNCEDREIHNFKVASFTEIACTATEFEENHRHDYFEIIWLKDGAGTHQIDLYNHDYKGSVLFLLTPGQIHKIEQRIPSEGYIVKFLPSVFRHEKEFFNYILDTCLFNTVTSCPVIKIPPNLNTILENLFRNLMKEFQYLEEDSENILSSYLKILITHINRLKRKKITEDTVTNNPHYALFREFKIVLEKKYKTEHSVQYYAGLLKINTRTLNTISKKYGEKSAIGIIQERILLEAQRCLYHESKSIKEICFDLGFDDPAYFTRFFKKHTGVAPQRFKERRARPA